MAPPGLNMAPPGLFPELSSQRSESAEETRCLQQERQRLMNQRMELETSRLAHENALLRASLMLPMMPPMLASSPPGVWAPPVATGKLQSLQQSERDSRCDSTSSSGSCSKRSASRGSTFEGSDSEVVTDADGNSADEVTVSVMMRNIPNSYDRGRLLSLLDNKGFSGCYDLVYLPLDFATHSSLGYAFINFVTEGDAKRFRESFHGFNSWGMFSDKACDTQGNATHQGIRANIDRYRNSPAMHETVPDEFRPAIFSNGVRVPFPPPTRRLRAPDFRCRKLSSGMGSVNN